MVSIAVCVDVPDMPLGSHSVPVCVLDSVVKDPLYWLNPATRAYEPFTEKCYKAIQTGEAKV